MKSVYCVFRGDGECSTLHAIHATAKSAMLHAKQLKENHEKMFPATKYTIKSSRVCNEVLLLSDGEDFGECISVCEVVVQNS